MNAPRYSRLLAARAQLGVGLKPAAGADVLIDGTSPRAETRPGPTAVPHRAHALCSR